ncbi:MAG: DNA polymerase III subunit beta [Clostridiales bacterium]|nr:DNA polymerase III subunit beta [Clostridiales bacterium]
MRIKLDKQSLCNAVATVNHAISSRTTMPILEGIKIKTTKEGVQFTCYDMTLGIETVILATVQEEGEAVVPGRLFYELTRKLPDDADVDMYFDKTSVEIVCAGSKTHIQTLPAEDFPMLPDIEENVQFNFSQEKIKNMIKRTLFAAAIDESRPVLTGVLFEIDSDSIRLISLDGYRMAISGKDIGEKENLVTAIVPSATLSEVGRLLENEGSVKISISQSHILFQTGNTRMISRLIEGEYIKYRQIIPMEWQTRFTMSSIALAQSIDRAATISSGSNNLVAFNIGSNQVNIDSENELGNVHEVITTQVEGKEIQIAFNARYISDILKNIESQDIVLSFTTNVSPCVITPAEDDDFLYLLLPVRIYTE